MSTEESKKRLRQHLNPAIQGQNTSSLIEAIATGTGHLIETTKRVDDQLYILTASERYLDARLAEYDLSRPDSVGLSDDIFRYLGIEVINRKQVRDLILEIMDVIFGQEYTKATMASTELQPYALENNDSIIIQFDDQEPTEVFFNSTDFSNILTATAQEVADAITKGLRALGKQGAAFAQDDGMGGYVTLISGTKGTSSSIKVLGGKAQNKLKFPAIRPTSGVPATQFTVSIEAGGNARFTWTGGPNPFLGKVKKGDYANIYGTSFNILNRGTFTIDVVQGGTVGNAYFEVVNANAVAEIVLQGTNEGVLFFNPIRTTVLSKSNYATVIQTQPRLIEIFVPATTKVVRRERKGAAHIQDGLASVDEQYGPYVFDPSKPYMISNEECNTTMNIDGDTGFLIDVDNSSDFPDSSGNVIFGFGTDKEEIVPYIGRPSSTTLYLNPAFKFKFTHLSGTNISLVNQNFAYDPAQDGSDMQAYCTDVVSGRLYVEELIRLVKATGIQLVVTVLYPGDYGIAGFGTENTEIVDIYGPDPI